MKITFENEIQTTGEYISLDGEEYFRISNSHQMPDFFMSLVGASDHWMFVSSRGALTAGRCDPDSALFPYAADDQIAVAQSVTGPTTLIRDLADGSIWEPFSVHPDTTDQLSRNLYKSPLGNKLVFEERNETRELVFRYRWVFSERFGFVRSCRLENAGPDRCSLQLLDGIRNLLPYGVGSEFMMRFSNLANAYKKSELISASGIGLFYLSSIPTDRAEPSEGLKTTVAWQSGLTPEAILLSTEQLTAFRSGAAVHTETDIRGKAGAYLVAQTIELQPGESLEWQLIADLSQDYADVVELDEWLQSKPDVATEVAADVEAGQRDLLRIVSSADAMQCGANPRRSNRHLSNTVFNVMRGGIPLAEYRVHRDDLLQHLAGFNRAATEKYRKQLQALPEVCDCSELRSRLESLGDPDLVRLVREYLPLAFSRRHGDPTRPWNRFAIHLRTSSGRMNLNYQGNWRDIFQNWEALAVSFPEFTTAMICRFVNATTADGYNPYRVTKGGFEWEEPTPEDPWANIGYWGDHQIIYLLKFLEWSRRVDPQGLTDLLSSGSFVHANVPYRIKGFAEIKQDPRSTIDFDAALSAEIRDRVAEVGTDGKLLRNQSGEIHRVNLLEKLLTLSLAKLSNFVPDGGIWLNTQRPEWNDANNALVGNGLSMVTACYLYRWFQFLQGWLAEQQSHPFQISEEVGDLLRRLQAILTSHVDGIEVGRESADRARLVESLSRAGCDYREQLYASGPSGQTTTVTGQECLKLFETACLHLEATIRNNRRSDGLFHSYNLLSWKESGLHIEHLYEMLEGQVAVLSSGLLSASEAVSLLDALRQSTLYRADQDSYVLYPNRQLPRFLEKNQVPEDAVVRSPLLKGLLNDGNEAIVRRDTRGDIHFCGDFRNAADLQEALAKLPSQYQTVVESHGSKLVQTFEDLFQHRQFTGRSGTFFAYEGLGSIYWHMVSKLELAVVEIYFAAIDGGASAETVAALRDHFQAIRRGIGAEKTPTEFGAFPTDPYSHTPENAGAKQPGMTGQVKEDILARFAEIGVVVQDGCLRFRTELFDPQELLQEPTTFTFFGPTGAAHEVAVPQYGFAFTFCQVPVLYHASDMDKVQVRYASGEIRSFDGMGLDAETSRKLFSRCGEITEIDVHTTTFSGWMT